MEMKFYYNINKKLLNWKTWNIPLGMPVENKFLQLKLNSSSLHLSPASFPSPFVQLHFDWVQEPIATPLPLVILQSICAEEPELKK